MVLAGQPNVGKSSLLNALAGDEVAIVTPIAGTTRDKVVQTIHVEGVPLNVVDTAGIREAGEGAEIELVESIGIQRTWDEVARADVIMHVLDAGRGPTREDEQIALRFPEGVPVIVVWNKIDVSGHHPMMDKGPEVTHVYLSAREHLGVDLLRDQLLQIAGWQQTGESAYMARERHLLGLRRASEHLERAADHAQQSDQALDLFAEELRLTQDHLNGITGAFGSDDLLGVIFSRFCIGK